MVAQTEAGELIDPRDGKKYKTAKIGEQIWLAENLNWEGAGVWYNNSSMLGNLYGRLYTWEEALAAAPPGWHLATDEEWQMLVDLAGGDEAAGGKLKAKDGWDGNGTDEFGFSALPGGSRSRGGGFRNAGGSGRWWSAKEKDIEYAYRLGMDNGVAEVYRNGHGKANSFSVRLVKG